MRSISSNWEPAISSWADTQTRAGCCVDTPVSSRPPRRTTTWVSPCSASRWRAWTRRPSGPGATADEVRAAVGAPTHMQRADIPLGEVAIWRYGDKRVALVDGIVDVVQVPANAHSLALRCDEQITSEIERVPQAGGVTVIDRAHGLGVQCVGAKPRVVFAYRPTSR